ncbi:MAG: glycosyltransferase, partial [Thiogranum sp.]
MYGQSTVIPGLAEADGVRRTRILFLVAEDWYFCSHRLPVARAARDAGCEVIVATRVDRHADHIRREGFTL